MLIIPKMVNIIQCVYISGGNDMVEVARWQRILQQLNTNQITMGSNHTPKSFIKN